ncbi:voltage-gated potassium channel protein [Acidocella sp.]|uniref:voltage-gated potassium channel protein n=1 Tax=Acidocella sp. TaxID=50710 RepID=UPI002F3F0C3C
MRSPSDLFHPSHFQPAFRRLAHRVRLDLWFPHLPLACAVGGAGALALVPTIRHFLYEYFHLRLSELFNALHPLTAGVPEVVLSGVPNAAIGWLQIFIAIGLLLRSRLAWISALLIALAQLALAVGYTHYSWHSSTALYLVALLCALSVAGRAFQRSSLAAGTLFALAATGLLLAYGVLGSLILGQGFTPPIETFQQAVYFTVVTMSTVGYGDILPKSDDARLFVVSLIIVGLSVFVTSITAVIGPLVQGRLSRIISPERKRMKRIDHFIIAGDGALARNTARELLARDRPVLVILDEEVAAFGDAEIVIGDPTDLDVLRRAGAETARAVLALSNDDAENAFVILALRELATDAKKVAAVSNRKNLERVRRVQPDMILAPNVFGGEVLAMALTDEKIDGASLVERFLDVNAQHN